MEMEDEIHAAIQADDVAFFARLDDSTLHRFRHSGGQSLLQAASRAGSADLTAYLVRRGLDLNSTDDQGATPLMDAITFGYDGIVSLLLDAGADIRRQDSYGHDALWIACTMNNVGAATLLLQRVESLDQRYPDTTTPLIAAAMFGADADVALLEVLLAAGADVDARDQAGYTAMTHSVMNGRLDQVEVLLSHGADPTQRTVDGRSLIDFVDSIEDESLKAAMRRLLGR